MEELMKGIIQFRDERNWAQFHNPKDLAISLSLEASELLELFQWKGNEEVIDKKKAELSEEIADILMYSYILCYELRLDPMQIVKDKLKRNSEKYPIDKAYGSSKKYTEL